jgi:hypothetical protein
MILLLSNLDLPGYCGDAQGSFRVLSIWAFAQMKRWSLQRTAPLSVQQFIDICFGDDEQFVARFHNVRTLWLCVELASPRRCCAVSGHCC